MTVYRPDQRQVPANVFTPVGWLSGQFHVGTNNAFLETVNAVQAFFKLTDVRMVETGEFLPFFCLQRHAAHIILPAEAAERMETLKKAEGTDKIVTCLLQSGSVKGALRLLADIRLSDFLFKCSGFFVLRDCTSALWQPDDAGAAVVAPIALINARHVVGITDCDMS